MAEKALKIYFLHKKSPASKPAEDFFIYAIKNKVSIKHGSEQMRGLLQPYGELLLSV